MSSEKLSFSLATGLCRRLQSPGLPEAPFVPAVSWGGGRQSPGIAGRGDLPPKSLGFVPLFVSLSPGFGESTRVPVVSSGMGLPFLWAYLGTSDCSLAGFSGVNKTGAIMPAAQLQTCCDDSKHLVLMVFLAMF